MITNETNILPIMPVKDLVMFPGIVTPLFVGKDKSVLALEKAVSEHQKLVFVTQKDNTNDYPIKNNIYKVGVVGNILQLVRFPDGSLKVLIEASSRVKINKIFDNKKFFEAEVEMIHEEIINQDEISLLMKSVINAFDNYIRLNKKSSQEIVASLVEIKDPSQLCDIVASNLSIRLSEKQKILEIFNINKRLEHLFSTIEAEIEILNTAKKIKNRVKKQIEKTQKEYYLNEQLKAIQKELSGGEESKTEISEIEKKLENTKMSKEATEKANNELKKLKMMNIFSSEASIVRNYLDWLLDMPWGKHSKTEINLNRAEEILEKDHYGLEKVKERILEYLAVQKRSKNSKSPIICLVGPPGVGKTSLAKSIAEATNREFVRLSLGGVRDESEIRGHRRTYVGSMPGKIIQYLKKSKTSNPVFLLDEIDKMGADYKGDPAAALLEVLDPEQNNKFIDHFLEVEYDLSKVMFIATANSYNIPRPLIDRMEIIKVSSYTEEEKLEIAKRHLVKKIMHEHHLKDSEFQINEEAILDIIRGYTKEAGLRNLERELAKIARKSVKKLSKEKISNLYINRENLVEYAGVKKFTFNEIEEEDLTGVTNGLAYSDTGGDVLAIEAVTIPGQGNIKTTGKLGEVMQESAQAAFSFFKSKCNDFGIKISDFKDKDIHLHVPEGAINKDGPSAGIAMFTSIVSILTGIPVKKTVAMTGEITLRGRVLAIGGLKEKLLSALRSGIKTVIIPKENLKDLDDMPVSVIEKLKILPVSMAHEVPSIALVKEIDMMIDEKNDISNILTERNQIAEIAVTV